MIKRVLMQSGTRLHEPESVAEAHGTITLTKRAAADVCIWQVG